MTTRLTLSAGRPEPQTAPQTIDMTPTWAAIMPALVAALQHGTPEGQRLAAAELESLAAKVDAMNRAAKARAGLAADCMAALIDGAAMLAAYAEGQTHNESRGQARATIREMRAAIARLSDNPETPKGL